MEYLMQNRRKTKKQQVQTSRKKNMKLTVVFNLNDEGVRRYLWMVLRLELGKLLGLVHHRIEVKRD